MSTVKDMLGALRDVLVMNSKIDATAEAVRELTRDVKALQQEVAELRGMLRGAALASRLALPKSAKE
ncbi:MAG: hypothetical protein ACREP2_11525 [Rhodanobacteraceae bacterium]